MLKKYFKKFSLFDNNKQLSTKIMFVFYLIVCFYITSFSLKNPFYNWDIIGYVAAAKSFETTDHITLHNVIYDELKKVTAKDKYSYLTSNEFRKEMEINAKAFEQQLPFYQIRIIYVAAIYILAKLGMNMFYATHFISAISIFMSLILLYFTFRKVINSHILFTLPFYAVFIGIMKVARHSSPDGLTLLIVTGIAYLWLGNSRWVFFLLPLSVLVRTDLILFVVPLCIYFFLYSKQWKNDALISLGVCTLCYIGVNSIFDNYGWATIFVYTFMKKLIYPAEVSIRLGLVDYYKVFMNSIFYSLTYSSMFFLYIYISILGIFAYKKKYKVKLTNQTNQEKVFVLSIISLFYVSAHFMLFPATWERFFMAQYLFLFMLIGLLFNSSKDIAK